MIIIQIYQMNLFLHKKTNQMKRVSVIEKIDTGKLKNNYLGLLTNLNNPTNPFINQQMKQI